MRNSPYSMASEASLSCLKLTLNSHCSSTKSSIIDPTLKTRHFSDVIQEITRSMQIHRDKGTILGGVHLELTGEVNEEGYSVVCIIVPGQQSKARTS